MPALTQRTEFSGARYVRGAALPGRISVSLEGLSFSTRRPERAVVDADLALPWPQIGRLRVARPWSAANGRFPRTRVLIECADGSVERWFLGRPRRRLADFAEAVAAAGGPPVAGT